MSYVRLQSIVFLRKKMNHHTTMDSTVFQCVGSHPSHPHSKQTFVCLMIINGKIKLYFSKLKFKNLSTRSKILTIHAPLHRNLLQNISTLVLGAVLRVPLFEFGESEILCINLKLPLSMASEFSFTLSHCLTVVCLGYSRYDTKCERRLLCQFELASASVHGGTAES